MSKAPAFQFYPKDWLTDKKVMRLSYEAQGVYLRLLCHMWTDSDDQCSIENDPEFLRSLLKLSRKKFEKIFQQLQWEKNKIFDEADGLLISRRLEKEKLKQIDISKKRSKAALKRHGKNHANAEQVQCKRPAKSCSSSSSSSYSSSSCQKTQNNNPPLSTTYSCPPLEVGAGAKNENKAQIYDEIIDLYHKLLPTLPTVRVRTRIYTTLKSRIKEAKERQTVTWWRDYFLQVQASDFLMGRNSDWRANLDWLTGPKNMSKVLNGNYENHGPRTGSAQTDQNLRTAYAWAKGEL